MPMAPPNTEPVQQRGQNVSYRYQFDTNGRPTILKYQSDLQGAIAHLYCVRAVPGLVPATDPTINHIQSQEETCVADLMQAFFDVSSVNDNPGSKVISHCTLSESCVFSVEYVEATCRLVHSRLILRCRDGFRGHESRDWLGTLQSGAQRSSIEEDDISGDCQTRFTNVVTLLRKWKSVCNSIIGSASEIEGLVNAPATMLGAKLRSKQGNLTKKAKKERTENALKVAEDKVAQYTAETTSAPKSTQPTGALRGPGSAIAPNGAAQMNPSQAGGSIRPSNRGQNRSGPSSRLPNSTGPGGSTVFDSRSRHASPHQTGGAQGPRQPSIRTNANAYAAYGPNHHFPRYNHTNNYSHDFHYHLNGFGPIDPALLSPSVLPRGSSPNMVAGNSSGSAFGNGPRFGNGRDATYSPSMPPGIANDSGRSDILPSYDAGPSPLSNQATLSDMGTDVGLMYAMDRVKQGSIKFNRNNFAGYQDDFSGFGIASTYHPGRSSGPSSQLDRSVGPVAHPLSGPPVLLNGSKRSRQQSTEPDEQPPARRQKHDGNGADSHDFVDEDNHDAEDGDVGDDAYAEHESVTTDEWDSYDEALTGFNSEEGEDQ
ncbi:hypothetical protein HBH56_222210 [Parastagonospora nodorum]|uniref:Uncharacterized protein n=1 Tax=Phaeosphaeria nodorum (strain SN15 / ATCC MYA-4574 / FGSC 10173) TaxID=321614 RepID=A0A7U2F2E9_PHANO|nr:hypothetical protein HBH56_222210 [Parastagonospora nodorum]QRC97221.1 hypothetical protein JI435_139070 [Parastagonospora nodorum SN15]KAH3924147.1 hypothetical protein HBH54_199550 [Parastagonospora nodorum]KAH3944475.1 hypothetical protein HBH53_155910 [Parastagonospora nodorum]KAH3964823.1 hypothetical protein HBH52_209820 [Parastagonospora nodorum]